ncbi:MAG: asparagine synthase (glutamine-hydrolyzing) [Firmicutes bacterium]|nr:asparagine synthase (glutamine-hydrolyzing) [Bacillota bacterium]
MCGICGLQPPDPRERPPAAWLAGMCRQMAHRGPDEERLLVEHGMGLGFTRLAILDPEGGRQPLSGEDGSVAVVCNGEIYNHLELRRALEERGHRFRSRSDVEVIAHLYEEEGVAALRRLRGMFALAVWDRRRRQLLLARDRLGIKPLYVAALPGGGFAFASEIRALLTLPGLEARPDLAALEAYLAYRFVPGAATFFRGIRRLEPGHYLVVRRGRARGGRYWSWPGGAGAGEEAAAVAGAAPASGPEGEAEAARLLEATLAEAVELHLQADVPVGLLLSGGLDSAALLALAASRASRPLDTFSLGFARRGEPLPGFWELDEARATARRYGTRHHEVVVETAELPDRLEAVVDALEEPLGDPTVFPLERISQEVHRHGRVLLSGEGADELFGGYAVYRAAAAGRLLAGLPPGLRARLAGWAERWPAPLPGRNWLRRALLPVDAWYLCVGGLFDEAARERLLEPGLRAGPELGREPRPPAAGGAAADPLARMLEMDVTCMLPGDTLLKADKLTMAHSVELRVPFLDDRVVELAARIPARLKVRGRSFKYILRRALADRLPPGPAERRKLGFTAPVARLLREELRPLAEELLLSRRLAERGLFRRQEVERLLRRAAGGPGAAPAASRADGLAARQLFALLMLELWFRRWIDRPAAGRAALAEAAPAAGGTPPAGLQP